MSVKDNGGFDMAIELSEDAASSAVRSFTIPQSSSPFNGGGLVGQLTLSFAITLVKFTVPNLIGVATDVTGISTITQFTLGGNTEPVPLWMQTGNIGGAAAVDDELEMQMNALSVNWSEDPGRFPSIVLDLIDGDILASPVITFILAQAIMKDLEDGTPGTTYNAARSDILTGIKTAGMNAVRSRLNAIGLLALVPPPTLPGSIVITDATFLIDDRSIHLLYTLGGTPGHKEQITRSDLLRRTNDLLPLDVGAVVISNNSALRDFVGPGISGALGLSPSGFIVGHPFFWIGSTAIPLPPGISLLGGLSVTSVLLGIDGRNLRVLVSLVGTGLSGAFTVSSTIDATFSATFVATGHTLSMAITPVGTPAVVSDISIAWWVYVAAFVTEGLDLVAVLAAIDLFGGFLLDSFVSGFIAPLLPSVSFALPLPSALPAVSVRAQSLGQSDAPSRTVTLAPTSIMFLDPFLVNDVIINLL